MKRTRKLTLIITAIVSITMIATGCKKETTQPTDTGKTGELKPYKFTHYFNYDWWGLQPWAQDEVSKAIKEKFNVDIEFQKPDSDPQAKLNVMISSGDLPDSIMMDRGVDNIKLADLGLIVPLEPLMAKNPNLTQNLLPTTIEMLKIKGKLYGIPNWPRKAATGGNDAWITETKLYEAAGKPALNTFEDMHAYALKVKEQGKTKSGLSVIPFATASTKDGWTIAKGFYRSFGGYLDGWYSVQGGKYNLAFRDAAFKKATLEANKWWREGLMAETQFTDTGDQVLEKFVAGRTGLLWYDQSQDESNKFRRILREKDPTDGYEMVAPFPYPPANGLSKDKIYADAQSTVGWNVTCITKSAKDPQRIFDVWTYLYTQEAAILQMYGPKGQMWDKLNDKGLPELKKPESEWTTDEIKKLGTWAWMIPGHSDHVDATKFAVNAMQPKDKQNWVINNQANVITPLMWLSDEFVGIADVIDAKSDEGIKRTLCLDYIAAQYPKIIMAKSADEAEKLYNDVISFCDKNGMAKIEDIYTKKYQDNVKIVGTGLKK